MQREVCKDCWNTGTVVIQVAGRSVPDCWENFVYRGVYCLNVTESHGSAGLHTVKPIY